MSSKSVLWLVGVIVVVVGVWYFWGRSSMPANTTPTQQAGTQQPTGTSAKVNTSASLDQDLNAVDTQAAAASSASASANSTSDTPVAQTE